MGHWDSMPQEDWDAESWRFKPLPSLELLGIFPVQREKSVYHHWRQPHCSNEPAVPYVLLISAGGMYKWPDREKQKKALKENFRYPPGFAHLVFTFFFIVWHQVLKLRSWPQSEKASYKGECLLQEGIRVGDEPGINRKLGLDFQGAPEIADMLSLKCKRRRAEQKYIGFMGDLED